MSEPRKLVNTFARIYRRLSIRRKLLVLITGVAGLVTLISMVASFAIELSLFKDRLLEEYRATARMTAGNLNAAILFEDSRDATDTLAVLSVQKRIESAGVYLPDGSLFAAYLSEELGPNAAPPPLSAKTGFVGRHIVVKETVYESGTPVATLVLTANQGELNAFKFARSVLFVVLLILSIATAILLARRFGARLAEPIIELAETARRITEDQDVSTRQVRTTEDETGRLVDAFNEMMEQIEKRSIALVTAKDEAEASSRAKDDFLSVISHELRTPLNPIIGYVEIQLRKAQSEEDRKQLGLVKQYAEHLQNLIDRVIDFSRFERGVVPINDEPVDYERLCQNVLTLLSQQATDKGIELVGRHQWLNEEISDRKTISTDRVKLQQIVLNLVANALKFTEAGSIALNTTTYLNEEGKSHLRIEVVDTGIGISEEDRAKVFKPFSQIDASLTRQYSGMGLGLAITHKIVHALGGEIDFESAPGKGSRFWLELPIQFSEEEDPDPAAPNTVLTENTGSSRRILLVDDQLVNLELGESMLSGCGHVVVCASSGPEAIELARAQSFQLIILDIKMPRMNGYETARELRKLDTVGEQTPIIALTAHITTQGSLQCREAGIDDFLSKPFNTERLNLILSRWLGHA